MWVRHMYAPPNTCVALVANGGSPIRHPSTSKCYGDDVGGGPNVEENAWIAASTSRILVAQDVSTDFLQVPSWREALLSSKCSKAKVIMSSKEKVEGADRNLHKKAPKLVCDRLLRHQCRQTNQPKTKF